MLHEQQLYVDVGVETHYGGFWGKDYSLYGGALAYSPIESIYVEAGGNFKLGIKPFTEDFKSQFGYGAVGFYEWISPAFLIESSIGYGKGKTETYDVIDDFPSSKYDHSIAFFDRLHAQASLGWRIIISADEKPYCQSVFHF
jgi:hypothetical protein